MAGARFWKILPMTPWPGTGSSGGSADMDIGQSMNRSLKWMALGGLACLMSSRAAAAEFVERPANSAQEAHRFLFVVETSAANRKFENANRQAVSDLIVGGVNGQMRSGDTYGIWTFSDEVKAGEFPVTVWAKEQSLDLAGQADAFLQKQRYAKRTILQLLVDDLRRLSDRVGDFNVFIISSGRDPIDGTPWDQNINAAYRSLGKQSGKSGRPLVTTFVVRKGRPVRAGVVLAGDRIILPERLPEPPPKRMPASTNATAALTASSNALAAAEPPPAPRKKVMHIVTKSNTPAATLPVISSAPLSSTNETNAVLTAGVEPLEAATNSVAETPPIQVAAGISALVPAAEPGALASVPAIVPALNPAIQPDSNPTAPVPPVGPTPEPDPVSTSRTTVAPIQNASAPPTPTLALAGPTAGPANWSEASAVFVMAREPAPGFNANAESSQVPLLQGSVVLVRTVDGLSAGALLAIGGTLLGAACFLLVMLVRRGSMDARGSLITQAMRPHRKM